VRNGRTAVAGAAVLAAGGEDAGYLKGGDGRWPGDIFQVGGVFVLGPGNACEYAYRSQYAGDHPDINDVFAAATGLTSTGADFQYPMAKRWANRLRVDEVVALPGEWWQRLSPRLVAMCFVVVACSAIVLRVGSRIQAALGGGAAGWEQAPAVAFIALAEPWTLCVVLAVGTLVMAAVLEWALRRGDAFRSVPPLVTPAMVDRVAIEWNLIECECGSQDIPAVDAAAKPPPAAPLSTSPSPLRPPSRPSSRPSSRPPSPVLGDAGVRGGRRARDAT